MARSGTKNRSRPQPRLSPATEPVSAPEGVAWIPMGATKQPTPDAVTTFGRAMASLQQRDYRGALAHFEDLLQRFPNEWTLLDRVRVYAAACQRALGQDHPPTTVEERLTAATAALNDGQNQRAAQLISQVVDEAPGHELGFYLLAVVHARRGAPAEALDALTRAVALSPEVLAQARHDEDFESLRGHEAFERLMAGAPARSGNPR
jgi:predicted Zn-dependent protease